MLNNTNILNVLHLTLLTDVFAADFQMTLDKHDICVSFLFCYY